MLPLTVKLRAIDRAHSLVGQSEEGVTFCGGRRLSAPGARNPGGVLMPLPPMTKGASDEHQDPDQPRVV